jgi:hypothetical protein
MRVLAKAGDVDYIAVRTNRDYLETNSASRLVGKSVAPRDRLHVNKLCRHSPVRLIALHNRPQVPEVIEDHGQRVAFIIYLQPITFGGAGGFCGRNHRRGIFHIKPCDRTYNPGAFGKKGPARHGWASGSRFEPTALTPRPCNMISTAINSP